MISTSGAIAALHTHPDTLRRHHIAARVPMSASLAGLLATLALGEPRGDLVALHTLTAERVAASHAGGC